MRPSKIVDQLPEFTPALLDIAAHTIEPFSSLPEVGRVPQGAARDWEADVSRLDSLHDVVRRDWWAAPAGRDVVIRREAGRSLRALARVNGYAAELEGYEKSEVGRAVRKMARAAITDATRDRDYFREDVHDSHRIHRNRRLLGNDEHVISHADSYRTLLPIMRWPTRFYVSRVLRRKNSSVSTKPESAK